MVFIIIVRDFHNTLTLDMFFFVCSPSHRNRSSGMNSYHIWLRGGAVVTPTPHGGGVVPTLIGV